MIQRPPLNKNSVIRSVKRTIGAHAGKELGYYEMLAIVAYCKEKAEELKPCSR